MEKRPEGSGVWPRIILFMSAHFAHHVLTALLVPLLPFIRDDFGLNYAQSGMVVSALTLSYGLANLPAGWLADRAGPRVLLLVGISGVAVAGVLIGLSSGIPLLIGALLLMGLMAGGYHPSAAPLIGANVSAGNQGRALGFHVVGGSTSHFLAPLIGVGIASVIGWRGTFLSLSFPVFLFGLLLFWRLGRPRADAGDGREGAGAAVSPERTVRIVAFMLLAGLYGAFVSSIVSFVPLFMVDRFGVSEKTAAAFLSIVYAAGFFAAPLGGHLSDRLGRVRVMIVLAFLLGPMIALLVLVPYGVWFGALLLVIGILMFIKMPTVEAYIIESVQLRHRSTILGIYFFSGTEGSALINPILGSIIDRRGFEWGFGSASAVFMVLVLVCSVLIRAGKREARV